MDVSTLLLSFFKETQETEDDGDLNLFLAGVACDLDSPQDIDRPKKSTKKKTATKTKYSSSKKKRK